ncbi:hypothetical protein QYE76_028337 [Lolium multiflorum]|uniref:RNase H type-1 domain-containing protein n=1 Tax=Lolium multiflorum TaxID=4521 RepID=A0AAD8QP44_LOLMU|nr:hypothetical protein QYE76_028337 [Lolium multiflorum]
MKLNPAKCTFGVPLASSLATSSLSEGSNPDKISALEKMELPEGFKDVRVAARVSLSRFAPRAGRRHRLRLIDEEGGQVHRSPQKVRKLQDLRVLNRANFCNAGFNGVMSCTSHHQSGVGLALFRWWSAKKTAGSSCQRPVYYLSEVLSQSKQNYPHYQKVTYGVYMAAKKLKHYFQEHLIKTGPPRPDSTHRKMHYLFEDAQPAGGAGIVLTSPKGDRLDYVLQIHFVASNNVAEYEALIHGLKLAKEIGVRRILCFGDSDLVIQQASGDWDAKDANMASYRFHVQQLSGFFDGCEFHHVPRANNEAADALLLTVADAFRLIGATHIHDSWIKEKYIECMMPYVPIDVKTLVGRECYSSLSSQDAVQMQALKVLEQNSHDSLNRAIGMSKGNNLALAVNSVEEVIPQESYRASWSMSYPEDLQCHYHDHMAFHAKSFWVDPSKAKEDNIKRNNKSGFTSFGPKTRSCYNCDDKRHFIAECPYENRELHNGRLIPKDKSKDTKGKYSKAPNKKFYNNKTKKGKRPSRVVLVTKEEYSSDEVGSSSSEDEEEESSKEVAAIATTNNPSSSLFESPNENPHIRMHIASWQGRTSRGTSRRRARADRSSDEFVSNAPRKSTSSRHKNKASRENYKTMDPISYSAIRMKNWYEDLPRDEETEGRKYWCMEQEFIYKDIYEPMKKVRPMQAIDVDVLAVNNHFEDAIWVTGRMGLKDLMKIRCDYSPELVKQFFATRPSSPWTSEADKNALFDLYTSAGKVGETKGLLSIYSQFLRFFRSTIAPSGGNNDAIRGALVDLMYLSFRCARDENEERNYTIDVMDFIFHEIHDAMVSRTTIPYAPYIQLLINNTAVRGEDLSGYPLMKHSVKKAYKLKPVSSAVPPPDSFMGDARSSGFAPARHPDLPAMKKQVNRLSWFQRYILCMNIEIHKENFAASRERAEIKHTQAVILHKLSGEQGPPPQPPVHPGYSGWHSAQVPWSDLDSCIQRSSLTRRSPDAPDTDEEEEEEEEEAHESDDDDASE